MSNGTCNKCGAVLMRYYLKNGTCRACLNPDSVVTALVRYQVTIQEKNEVSQFVIDASAPRLAFESGISKMGFAPHKFNTTMDIEQSNVRRVVYTSKGRGDTVLIGMVKPLEGDNNG